MAKLVQLEQDAAVVHVECGVRLGDRREVRKGSWRVKLAGARFSWASNLQNLAQGHVTQIPKNEWERRVREAGWSGTVRIDGLRAHLSNGPTVDICGGEIP